MTPDELDQKLRVAWTAQPLDTAGAEAGIRLAIRRESRRAQLRTLAIAATVVVAAALGALWFLRPQPEPKIFADAARDHRVEVVQGAPRHWRTADTEIDTLTARFGLTRERVAFTGYQLTKARICLLEGQRVLHLVYSDGARDYSLYLAANATAVPNRDARDGAQNIAGFHSTRLTGLVVGEGSPSDCRRFAQTVTKSAGKS